MKKPSDKPAPVRIFLKYRHNDGKTTDEIVDIEMATLDAGSSEIRQGFIVGTDSNRNIKTKFFGSRIIEARNAETDEPIADLTKFLRNRIEVRDDDYWAKRREERERAADLRARVGRYTADRSEAWGDLSCKAENILIPIGCTYMTSTGSVSNLNIRVTGFFCRWTEDGISVLTALQCPPVDKPRGVLNAYRILEAWDPESGEIIDDLATFLSKRAGALLTTINAAPAPAKTYPWQQKLD